MTNDKVDEALKLLLDKLFEEEVELHTCLKDVLEQTEVPVSQLPELSSRFSNADEERDGQSDYDCSYYEQYLLGLNFLAELASPQETHMILIFTKAFREEDLEGWIDLKQMHELCVELGLITEITVPLEIVTALDQLGYDGN